MPGIEYYPPPVTGFNGKAPTSQPAEVKAAGAGKLELGFLEQLALGYEEIRTVLHEYGLTK